MLRVARKYYLHTVEWLRKHVSPYQSIVVLSVSIGLLSGLAGIALKSLIHFIEASGIKFFPDYQFFLTPVTGLLIVVFLNQHVFSKVGTFHGIGDIVNTIRKKSAAIHFMLTYAKLITAAITVGFGGSSGLESPIVVTGSAIGSNLARFFRLDVNYKILFIGCGAAAGIAAIFGAPIAGVIFAMEVIMPRFTATYFIPVLLASASGKLLADVVAPASTFSVETQWFFTFSQLPFILILGILGGLVSLYSTRLSWATKTLFLKVKSPYNRAIIGGLFLGVLVFCFPRLYGEGYVGITNLFTKTGDDLLPPLWQDRGIDAIWVLPVVFLALVFLKPLAANITIHSGGEGGHFAPSFITGGYLGYFIYLVAGVLFPYIHLSYTVFVLLGMAAVMSGVMHAPLTAIFLIAEITGGYELLVPLMIVSALSFLTKYTFEKQPIHFQRGESPSTGHSRELSTLESVELLHLADHDYNTLTPENTLREILQVLSASKRNFFPVVDAENNLLGVITLDDLRQVMFDPAQMDKLKVKDLMHMPPASLDSNEHLFSALEKFDRTNYWNLPVLRDGKFAGFISKSTLLDKLRKEVDKNQDIF